MALAQARTLEQLAAEARKAADALERLHADPALLKQVGILSVSGVKDHFRAGAGPDGIPWPPLKLRQGKTLQDTGQMANRTAYAVRGNAVVLTNNAVQARLHNEGGTITAKNKYLAIPVTPAAKRAGSPRRVSGLSMRRRKGATSAVLVDKKGRVQFVLKPSVRVPRRTFMGWSKATLERIDKAIRERVAKVV